MSWQVLACEIVETWQALVSEVMKTSAGQSAVLGPDSLDNVDSSLKGFLDQKLPVELRTSVCLKEFLAKQGGRKMS